MIKIFESVIFVSILQKLAILLFIAVFLAAVWAKGRIGKKKMNGEQWEEYFRSLSNRQFVVMFFCAVSSCHIFDISGRLWNLHMDGTG